MTISFVSIFPFFVKSPFFLDTFALHDPRGFQTKSRNANVGISTAANRRVSDEETIVRKFRALLARNAASVVRDREW